jgi:LysM repeat protein
VADSRAKSRSGGPTAIVLGLLIVVVIVAVVLLVGIGGGGGGGEGTKSRATHLETTRASSTTSTTTRPPFTYSVKPGNTLTALAVFFGVSKSDIIAANPNLNPDHLVEGQTLVIPSPRAVTLVVKPREVVVGGSLRLKLTGAKDFENVTFEFQRPTAPFVGPAHAASETGVVTTTYKLGIADPPGTYTVTAKGDQGTLVRATFNVKAARP